MKKKKGFSLIEIGIVMIVIGILISAVMKGKDVIKSAEIKQLNQTFLSKWVAVTASYYDKLGYNLSASPTSNTMLVADGLSDADGNGTIGCNNLILYTKRAGINLQKIINTNSGNPCRTTIAGEFTDEVTVAVGLESFRINTTQESNTTRNFVLFFNMPGDIALSYDRLVDNQADLTNGKVIALEEYTNSSPKVAGSLEDNNLTTGASGLEPISGEIDGEKLYTIGVILDH